MEDSIGTQHEQPGARGMREEKDNNYEIRTGVSGAFKGSPRSRLASLSLGLKETSHSLPEFCADSHCYFSGIEDFPATKFFLSIVLLVYLLSAWS